jgi:hypothetical protein
MDKHVPGCGGPHRVRGVLSPSAGFYLRNLQFGGLGDQFITLGAFPIGKLARTVDLVRRRLHAIPSNVQDLKAHASIAKTSAGAVLPRVHRSHFWPCANSTRLLERQIKKTLTDESSTRMTITVTNGVDLETCRNCKEQPVDEMSNRLAAYCPIILGNRA